MSYYYGNSTILHLLWLWPTQHHMTQHCCLRLSESFHPNLVPFYSHSDGLSWWHLKLCVTSACICFLLSVRAEAAVQPRHRGRWKKRWRDNRVDQSALSGCSSWHTGEACEIPFEVHQCAHFKVHLPVPACTPSETRRGDTIRWNKSA